jgi:glyoxylase-like metal-dependent hydrolase (beta-lactamase superfamily II)
MTQRRLRDLPFPIEVSHRPWFGPTLRAREHLTARRSLLAPDKAAKEIVRILGYSSKSIERIRFIDFVHSEHGNYRYTLALIWTDSNATARQTVYEMATEVVQCTGWYPIAQGERLASRLAEEVKWASVKRTTLPHLSLMAPLESIQTAVSADGGCSIRLSCSSGSILLDAGLPGYLTLLDEDRVILLSHLHSDHFGGIENGATRTLPVIMSRGTAQILLTQSRLSETEIGISRFIMEPDDNWTAVGEGIELKSFPVPHAPGSVGYLIRDPERAILYSGDIALRSHRHDFRTDLHNLLNVVERSKKWLLLDATMAGRIAGASEVNAARELFEHTRPFCDVIVLSRDPEQLLYAYLDIFHYAKGNKELRTRTHFIAPPRLRDLFQVLHSSFIAREMDRLDRFILLQYGSSMSAWGESRSLYWRTSNAELPETIEGERRIWFLTVDDQTPSAFSEQAGVVTIARVDTEEAAARFSAVPVHIDTSAWTLHSDEISLAETIQDLQHEAKIVLFHNFPNRIKKFAEFRHLECSAITSSTLVLEK